MTRRAALMKTRHQEFFAECEPEARPVRQPRFRSVDLDSPLHRAGAIYALRMIQGTRLHTRLIKRGDIRDPDLLGLVGLEMNQPPEGALTPSELLAALNRQGSHLVRRGRPSLRKLDCNITRLGNILKLTAAETSVLRLAVVVSRVEAFQDLFRIRTGLLQSFFGMVQHALQLRPLDVQQSLGSGSVLRRAGILQPGLSYTYGSHPLEMDEEMATLLLAPRFDEKILLRHILSTAPAATLTLKDFPDRMDITMLRRYLGAVIRRRRKGVNILIHGATGTGKTEFVRALAHDLGVALSEVPTEDSSGDPISGDQRFRAFSLAQTLLAAKPKQLLLFDEVEDVFGSGSDHSPFGGAFRSAEKRVAKGWVNQTLETNPVPAIWVCNSIAAFDAAYLRRFDLALEFRGPTGAYRRRVVDRHLDEGLVSEQSRETLAAMEALPPASIQRVARVVRALKSPRQTDRDREAEEVARLALQAMGRSAHVMCLGLPAHYDPAFLNTKPDVTALSKGLTERRSARLCLYGPPGTGKTAFAHHLAQILDVPLHLKRASDLQSMWVGQTEKNIAKAFQAAREEGALLLIDEADSFLQDRNNAHRSWEVSQVNEMLTQMEAFEGIFIASTNLMDSLDAASLRRFDFKVHFGYLTRDQRRSLLARVTVETQADGSASRLSERLDRMDSLTPGDFANVLRQLKVLEQPATQARILELLEAEVLFKPGANLRRIGF